MIFQSLLRKSNRFYYVLSHFDQTSTSNNIKIIGTVVPVISKTFKYFIFEFYLLIFFIFFNSFFSFFKKENIFNPQK